MITRRLLIALFATLLCACDGGGGGGYGSSNPPAPAPPTGSPPPPVTIIDIAQPWARATPAEVDMDEVMLGRAASDAATIPRFRSLLVARRGKLVAYVVPSMDLVVVATTHWQGLSAETNATTFASTVLTIIVNDVLPAARN
jgi:hypothetical protein